MSSLPSDRYIAEALAASITSRRVDPEEVMAFLAEIRRRESESPAVIEGPTCGPVALGLLLVAVSVGVRLVAALLFRPQQQSRGGGGQEVRQTQTEGRNLTRASGFLPRQGFDAIQEPAVLQTPIPLIYGLQESLPAQEDPPRPEGIYGGLRISFPLLWSQLQSRGGSQFLRAIFMVGEARVPCFDPRGFAFGDTVLNAYEIGSSASQERTARMSIYCADKGGRIEGKHWIAGRAAALDPGNAENQGAPDVFHVPGSDNSLKPLVSVSARPTAQTTFGLYGHCPHDFAYRVNPRLRSTISFSVITEGDRAVAKTYDDLGALTEVWKARTVWPGRSGVTAVNGLSEPGPVNVNEGDVITYQLSATTDANVEIVMGPDNSDGPDNLREELRQTLADVGSGVAARQRRASENLEIGGLYKIGTALAVLTSKAPEDRRFVSGAENDPIGNGVSVSYSFEVAREGRLEIIEPERFAPDSLKRYRPERWFRLEEDLKDVEAINYPYGNATARPQVFRCEVASFRLTVPSRVIEIGIRSTVGISVTGLCNFRDTVPIEEMNEQAGQRYDGDSSPIDETVEYLIDQQSSGIVQGDFERLSPFFLLYRKDGEDKSFVDFGRTFIIRSNTSTALYNYVRIVMQEEALWEVALEPASGYEVRVNPWGRVSQTLCILDGTLNTTKAQTDANGITCHFTGEEATRQQSLFRMRDLEPRRDLGMTYLEPDEESMFDSWGKIAEAFVFDEIRTTAAQGPEHEIVYVNAFSSEDEPAPTYPHITIIGLCISAAKAWRQLTQFSGYVTAGRTLHSLIGNSAKLLAGAPEDTLDFYSSHLWPDILRDILRSKRFGLGRLTTPKSINVESFLAAATMNQRRRYFWDGAVVEPTNIEEWASRIAPMMLLSVNYRNNQWCLDPALHWDEPVPISGIFHAGNIEEGSFRLKTRGTLTERKRRISVRWREERQRTANVFGSRGLFPTPREVEVRGPGDGNTVPLQAFKCDEFMTNIWHAIDFAAFMYRYRVLVDHDIFFKVAPGHIQQPIGPGSYIQVPVNAERFNAFETGVTLADGRIISSAGLGDGSYQVIAWDGGEDAPADTTLTITDGIGNLPGTAWAIRRGGVQIRTYQLESVKIDSRGLISIAAEHHPTDEAGMSLLAKNWTTYATDENFVILEA